MSRTSRRLSSIRSIFQSEFVLRTVSAIALGTVAVALTVWSAWSFTFLAAAASVVLAWEWGRVVRGITPDPAFYAHAGAAAGACVLAAAGFVTDAFLLLGAGAIAAALLSTSHETWLWSAFGVLYLGLGAVMLVLVRGDPSYGLTAVLFLFLVVWSADTAAYISGRLIGGPRLAPAISPGKTWAGFAGGLAVPTLLACGFALWLKGTSTLGLALCGAGLALASQIGDLTESAIKRKFKVKDSGRLLPGHGGLFDRVDGLIGTALAAGLLGALREPSAPGTALLIWP